MTEQQTYTAKDTVFEEAKEIMYGDKYFPEFDLILESKLTEEFSEEELKEAYDELRPKLESLYWEEPAETGAWKHL